MADSLLPYANPNNTFPKPATYLSGLTVSGGLVTDTVTNTGATVVSGGITITGGVITDTVAASSTISAGGVVTATGLNTTAGLQVNTRIVTSGAVTVTTADGIISVNKTVGAATAVSLYATPATGDLIIIKDAKGDANTNNITITPAAGNIDNASTLVISAAKGAVRLAYDGTQWISV